MTCGRPCCEEVGSKGCSVCLQESYCSAECQKLDQKIHKIMCPSMKICTKLLPFIEVEAFTCELEKQAEIKKGTESGIRLYKYYLLFAEHQYGDRAVGKSYREREMVRSDNWDVEFLLASLYCSLGGDNYRMLTNDIDGTSIRLDIFKKAMESHGECKAI